MVRAAAKNFDAVAVVTSPMLYRTVLKHLTAQDGSLTKAQRLDLATKAFAKITEYDDAIATYFTRLSGTPAPDFPLYRSISAQLWQPLRYGENPHQDAAFYIEPGITRPCVATAEQLHGKELSYNNILDLDSALNLAREFSEPAAVVVKHNNPCGAAVAA